MTSIQRVDRGPLAVGSQGRIRQPKLPPAVWQITELDEGRSFTWVTRSPGVRVTARHSVEASEGGSRATLSLQFSGLLGPLVARLTRGLNQRTSLLRREGSGRAAKAQQDRPAPTVKVHPLAKKANGRGGLAVSLFQFSAPLLLTPQGMRRRLGAEH